MQHLINETLIIQLKFSSGKADSKEKNQMCECDNGIKLKHYDGYLILGLQQVSLINHQRRLIGRWCILSCGVITEKLTYTRICRERHAVKYSLSFLSQTGRGNSAFEFADGVYGSTNLIHMVSRSRIRLSWATHYVGDLR